MHFVPHFFKSFFLPDIQLAGFSSYVFPPRFVAWASQRISTFASEIFIHVQDVKQDFALFAHISEDALVEKVRQIFFYSLHDHTVSQFRQMMTLERFRSPELAELYSRRYVDRMIDYHADIFRTLISLGILRAEDPDTLALQYVSPVITLLSVCDRQPEREAECLEKLDAHVRLFFRTFNIKRGEP